jgi:choice-of-anchor B domain-containing protein
MPAGAAEAEVPCVEGKAGQYPCQNVDLLARVTPAVLGGSGGNDIWGWTDPQTGREYALVGRTNGTAFVDITVPTDPVYLGRLPTSPGSAGLFGSWRDIKVYKDHAFVVSEEPGHGMQVFDLTRLRGVTSPQTFTEDAHYYLFGSAHNIAINEDSGYAYALGSGATPLGTGCGGLHMIDIRDPKLPIPAGCFQTDLYTHDVQCVIYKGPDQGYQDAEICIASNEDTLTIVDVTNKALPMMLSRNPYPGASYTHQGWFTEDQRYFLLGDEGDESATGVNTTTYVWDLASLTSPQLIGVHRGRTKAIDHNLYTKGDLVYQANYRAGLQILSMEDVAQGQLREVGYFDLFPANDLAGFNGAWSNYPYFDSGVVVLNGMGEGLFVLRPRIADLSVTQSDDPDPAGAGQPVTYTLTVDNVGPGDATGVTVTDTLPAGATLVSASEGCAAAGGVVTCVIGSLGEGEQATITIEVTAGQAGQLTNVATVAGDQADHILGNDTSEETTTIT